MTSLAFKILVGIATVYLTVLAALFLFQSRLIYPASQERHAPAPGFEAVTLTTEDGVDLEAHWRPPEADKPTVVWFHGNAGSMAGSVNETRILATLGYGLLLAPYRGYGGNPGEPSEEGFYRDGRSAMAFLEEHGIDRGKRIIAGNSIGTGTAVQMAREYSPAALILVSPFTSLHDVGGGALPIFPVSWLMRDRYDNLSKLPEIDTAILVLHGTADEVVPFALGETLAGSNDRARLVPFENAGHDLSFWQDAQIAQAEWLAEQGL